MNKNAKMGILSLLLWASLLTLLALAFCGERLDFPAVLSYAVPLLFAGFYILVFIALKESRLRMFLFLAAGVALGLFFDRLHLSRGLWILAALGIGVVYILACSYLNFRQLKKALQPLNEAILAYQKDHDGEKCLEALDHCARNAPKTSLFKRPDAGTVSFTEHIQCEKIQILGDMGRLEERRAVIEQLRQETKRPELLKWLDKKEAECGLDRPDE